MQKQEKKWTKIKIERSEKQNQKRKNKKEIQCKGLKVVEGK